MLMPQLGSNFVIKIGQIVLKNRPDAILQKTLLGWIVAGEINNSTLVRKISRNFTVHFQLLDSNLTKFWKIEEVPSIKVSSTEEKIYEEHYNLHTTRNAELAT